MLALSSFFFVFGVVIMTMFGVRQTTSVVASGPLSLVGSPYYPMKNVSFHLDMADQILVKIKGAQDHLFSYIFLDESNYILYNNSSTRPDAKPIKSDFFGSDFSFTAVAASYSNYYLVMKSEYALGSNATYSVQVFKTDTLVEVCAFGGSVFSLSVLLATSSSRASFNGHALTISRDR